MFKIFVQAAFLAVITLSLGEATTNVLALANNPNNACALVDALGYIVATAVLLSGFDWLLSRKGK